MLVPTRNGFLSSSSLSSPPVLQTGLQVLRFNDKKEHRKITPPLPPPHFVLKLMDRRSVPNIPERLRPDGGRTGLVRAVGLKEVLMKVPSWIL